MPDNGQPDFAALRQRAQHLYEGMQDVQQNLSAAQASGYSGDGLVSATVAGDGRLLDLRIDASVIDPDDPEGLAGLVIAAVQAAQQNAAELQAEHAGAVSAQLNGILDGIRRATRSAVPQALPTFPAPSMLAPSQGGAAANRSAGQNRPSAVPASPNAGQVRPRTEPPRPSPGQFRPNSPSVPSRES
jgi:DNA-binding YbaB/EbfC family protein